MKKSEANQIVKEQLGEMYKVWSRNGLYYLGYTVNRATVNEFVSSSGYKALLSSASVKHPKLAFR